MNRHRLLGLVLLAALGCSAERASVSEFRVALLTPGSIADGGWNAGAYEGLERIRDELGAKVSHAETRTPAEFEEGFRDYASNGYALVFGHGFEYQAAAAKVGAEFPDTVFVTTSGNTLLSNVVPMVFELEQATFLCGVLAARMSHSGIVGLVGGRDLPSIRSTFLAFRAGVETTDPSAQVREVFIGNFDDVAAAREASRALLEEGADFLMHQANAAGHGVFRALSERAAAGGRAFGCGTNRNQNSMAPDVILASATLDIPAALVEVARRVRDGRFRPMPLRLGMAEGIVKLEFNPALVDRIPEAVRAELIDLEQGLRAGRVEAPRGAV